MPSAKAKADGADKADGKMKDGIRRHYDRW